MFHRKNPIAFASINLFFLELSGTILFHLLEKWSFADAFFYTGMILTTVGTYEPSPQHDLTKIIVVFYAFSGITLALYFLNIVKPSVDQLLTQFFDRLFFWKK